MDYLRKYTWVGKDLPTFPLPVRMQYRVQRAWEWIGLHTCLLPTLLPTTDHHTCCHQVFLSAFPFSLIPSAPMSSSSIAQKFPSLILLQPKHTSSSPIIPKYFIFLLYHSPSFFVLSVSWGHLPYKTVVKSVTMMDLFFLVH